VTAARLAAAAAAAVARSEATAGASRGIESRVAETETWAETGLEADDDARGRRWRIPDPRDTMRPEHGDEMGCCLVFCEGKGRRVERGLGALLMVSWCCVPVSDRGARGISTTKCSYPLLGVLRRHRYDGQEI
jgi:hypothetical protein